jgi:uncharacterized membrane protein
MAEKEQSRLQVFLDSDLVHSFLRSPVAIIATVATLICFAVAILARDLATLHQADLPRTDEWSEPAGLDS